MAQLPCTCDAQYGKLDKCPSHDLAVCRLALVSKFGFPFLSIVSMNYSQPKTRRSVFTLWKTCSLRMSCNLPFNSLTFPTILSTLSLSRLSILLVSPIARSSVNLTPPALAPAPENHPPTEIAAGPEGVKQSRCSPLSAAEKVNFDMVLDDVDVWDTTRWSLSKTSSTVMAMASSGVA